MNRVCHASNTDAHRSRHPTLSMVLRFRMHLIYFNDELLSYCTLLMPLSQARQFWYQRAFLCYFTQLT
jgi:hypothetical protein